MAYSVTIFFLEFSRTMADDEQKECSVCGDTEKISTTPCQPINHVFCYNCIFTHVQMKRTVNSAGKAVADCPLCRQMIQFFTSHGGKKKFKIYPPGKGPKGAEKRRHIYKNGHRFKRGHRPKTKNGALPKVKNAHSS